MSLNFCCNPNATLTFEVITDAIASDDSNFTIETKLIKVQAFMKAASGKIATQFQRLPGVDDTAIMVEVYCVIPRTLPVSIAEESIADCTFAGLKGKFYMHPLINAPFGRFGMGAGLEKRLGTRLIGWIQVSRSL